jgi:predicted DNA-binding transcriptional regulator YafY
VLTTIAGACRDHERLRLDYTDHHDNPSVRTVEPDRLVNWGRRWYLVAWDTDRADWRTFRVDRITPRTPTGPRFTPRPPPYDDIATYVSRRVSSAAWRHQARVLLHAPAEQITERVNTAVGLVEPVDEQRCVLVTGGNSIDSLAVHLGLLGVDFEILEPPELVEHVRLLGERYRRASSA